MILTRESLTIWDKIITRWLEEYKTAPLHVQFPSLPNPPMPEPPQRRSRRSAGTLPAIDPETFWLEGEKGDANWVSSACKVAPESPIHPRSQTMSTPVTANDISAEHLPHILPQYRKKALEAMRRLGRDIPPQFEAPEWTNPVAAKKGRFYQFIDYLATYSL